MDNKKIMLACTTAVFDNKSLGRLILWQEYYTKYASKLNANYLIAFDDGSPLTWLNKLDNVNVLTLTETFNDKLFQKEYCLPGIDKLIPAENGILNIIRFREKYGRRGAQGYIGALFPGWWRSFSFSAYLASELEFDKWIFVESDYLILTDRLFELINNSNEGYNCLWEPESDYAESSVQWCTKNQMHKLKKYYMIQGIMQEALWWQINRTNMEYIPEHILPMEPIKTFPDGTKIKAGRFMDDIYKEIPANPDGIGNITDISIFNINQIYAGKKIPKLNELLKEKEIKFRFV